MKTIKTTIFVLATIIFFISCNNDDDSSESTSITVSSNFTEKIVGEEFIFQVLNNDSFDVTSEAIIKIDGVAITGNTFSTFNVGSYAISATHEGFVSESINITIIAPENYTQKVLIENYTGTWCGWCPRNLYAIELAKAQNNNVISIALMNAEFESPDFSEMATVFGTNSNGYPNERINRLNEWTGIAYENLDQIFDLTGDNASLGLSINSSIINNSTIEVDVRVGFKNSFNQNLAIVACIIEKGLYADQINYYTGSGGLDSLYNSEDPIVNFEYNDVLRNFITPVLGTAISGNETNAGNVYNDHFSLVLANTINTNNIEVVTYVVNTITKEVINVQSAPIGENKLFD